MRKFFYFISALVITIGISDTLNAHYDSSRSKTLGVSRLAFLQLPPELPDNTIKKISDTVLKKDISINHKDSTANYSLDEIIVSSFKASANSPFAKTTISQKQIRKEASSHSLPMVLGLEPSVVATTEGGLGLGYSNLRVRGSDASRTNITLNGIAINDGESQEMFWVNLPSIGGAMQSIQLQRGVGTSGNGPGAFGATMSMQTLRASSNRYGNAELSLGSYDTYMTAIGLGSGKISLGNESTLSFDGRFAHNNTKGYIRNAKANLNSLFLQGVWENRSNLLKIIYIFGDQSTGITWDGSPIEIYATNRKYNSTGEYYDDEGNIHYYNNETDNYRQHHAQLHYVRVMSHNFDLNATLHFTKGDGYYENYKYNQKFSKYALDNQVIDGVTYKKSDFIIRQLMDNSYYAAILSFNYTPDNLKLIGGATISYYDGDHFGKLLWSKYNASIPANYNWYNNNGKKTDASIFIKAEYMLTNKWLLFLDLQGRNISYHLSGMDKDFVGIDKKLHYNFFNPKAGITYKPTPNSVFYSSIAIANREPSRSDVKESIKAGKTDELKKESMIDFELGYSLNTERFNGGINLYAMEYNNQLVATGRLTETGYVIQENIPDSYRRGIELMAEYKPLKWLAIGGNVTFSKNKLKNYTLYTDTYDNASDWNSVAQTKTYLKSSSLTLSPEIIGMGIIKTTPLKEFEIALSGKYVGKQYLDNSSEAISKVPSYFVMALNASKRFTIRDKYGLTLSLCIDNMLNRKYYSYGWIYKAKFASHEPDYIEKNVYAQATTHFIFRAVFDF